MGALPLRMTVSRHFMHTSLPVLPFGWHAQKKQDRATSAAPEIANQTTLIVGASDAKQRDP